MTTRLLLHEGMSRRPRPDNSNGLSSPLPIERQLRPHDAFRMKPRLKYSFFVCEVQELSFTGTFKIESSFYFTLHNHRQMYFENVSWDGVSDSSGWRFQEHIEIPHNC